METVFLTYMGLLNVNIYDGGQLQEHLRCIKYQLHNFILSLMSLCSHDGRYCTTRIPNTQCMVHLPTFEIIWVVYWDVWVCDHYVCMTRNVTPTHAFSCITHEYVYNLVVSPCKVYSLRGPLQGQCNLSTILFWTPPLRRYGRKGNLTNYPYSSSHHPANQQQPR